MDHQILTPNSCNLLNNSSVWLEIRLFYVRISPCVIDAVPHHLTLCHIRREIGVSLEINGSRTPSSDSAHLTLRRDRLNRETSEVTYLSTDSVRVTGGFEFEVHEDGKKLLCGSLERMEGEWSMDCYMAISAMEPWNSAFIQPKMGVSIEVYIAGCCAGVPVILTKTIHVSPKRKGGSRLRLLLDAIPEDEEIDKGNCNTNKDGDGFIRHKKSQITDPELKACDSSWKFGQSYYSEDMYAREDGQLSWFNAGVRVGVGIGLGMCIGLGIGVGLLMRSYRATTRNFRRTFQ